VEPQISQVAARQTSTMVLRPLRADDEGRVAAVEDMGAIVGKGRLGRQGAIKEVPAQSL